MFWTTFLCFRKALDQICLKTPCLFGVGNLAPIREKASAENRSHLPLCELNTLYGTLDKVPRSFFRCSWRVVLSIVGRVPTTDVLVLFDECSWACHGNYSPRTARGQPMDNPWTAHRHEPTIGPRIGHGHPMGSHRTPHEQPTDISWAARGQPADILRTACGQPTGSPLTTHGQPPRVP